MDHYNKGVQSYIAKDFKNSLYHFEGCLKIKPEVPVIRYATVCLYALNNQPNEALKILEKLIENGYEFRLKTDNDLDNLRKLEKFRSLLHLAERMKKPISNSDTAFIIKDKDLIPESIAYDPVENVFYAGSLYKCKLLKINLDGTFQDFLTEKQDGLWSILGIKIDATRRVLWVNTAAGRRMKGFKEENYGQTAIYKYSLENGKLIRKYLPPVDSQLHLFNDLTLAVNGDVYLTDYLQGAVYKIKEGNYFPELFIKTQRLLYANGISISDDNRFLFVAHSNGITRIELSSSALLELKPPPKKTLADADGIYFYNNSIIAIQTDQQRVNRYWLNKKLNQVARTEILESWNPAFDQPTTGVLAGDTFYYIANSQYNSFEDGVIYPPEKLKNVIILKTTLKSILK